jgi:hypothetical protein
MEEFVKSVGVHGPRWVSEVLKKDLRNDQEFDSAKDFVKRVLIPTSDSCAGAAAERT